MKKRKICEICGSDRGVSRTEWNGNFMDMCGIHRGRVRHSGTIYTKRQIKEMSECIICGISGSETNLIESKINGLIGFYCKTHYWKLHAYRDGNKRTKRDKNEIMDHDDYLEIKLYDSEGGYLKSAYASKEHRELISKYKWSEMYDEKGYTSYATASTKNEYGNDTTISMHALIGREVLGKRPYRHTVDHIDRNGLNNRDGNLRYATHSEQRHNTRIPKNNKSGVKGVRYCDYSNCWMSTININKKRYRMKFDNFEDAVKQRQAWELEYKTLPQTNTGEIVL